MGTGRAEQYVRFHAGLVGALVGALLGVELRFVRQTPTTASLGEGEAPPGRHGSPWVTAGDAERGQGLGEIM